MSWLQGKKTRIIAAIGSALIVLIQLGYLDGVNYDRWIDLLTFTGFVTVHAAVVRDR